MEAEPFHADGRTAMTKLIAAFRSFVNAPKKTQYWTRLSTKSVWSPSLQDVFRATMGTGFFLGSNAAGTLTTHHHEAPRLKNE